MGADHWDTVDPTVPLLLLPVRIETRSTLDGAALRVRIYPDDIHVDGFTEELSDAEVNAGKEYWQARWPAEPPVDAPNPWSELLAATGPRRAAWVAAVMTPENLADRPDAPPVFPPLPNEQGADGIWARLLPDCFRVVVDQAGARTSVVGAPIDPAGIALGPGLDLRKFGATEKLGAMVDSLRGQPGIEADPAIAWLTDYSAAEAAGMAVTIQLNNPGARVDNLYVLGVRAADAPEAAAASVEDLLRAHAYGDGMSFIAPGTATNNTAASRSAWSRAASAPGEPPIVATSTPDPNTNAEVLATALDIDPQTLNGLDGAYRTDRASAAAFATALWPVTWGTFLDKTLTQNAAGGAVPADAREAVRRHAVEHVRGRGPLPTVRVGKQPYGILPTTAHGAKWQPIEGGYIDDLLAGLLARIRPLWSRGAASVPTVTTGNIEKDLPEILGQTPVSQGVRVRTALDADATAPVGDSLGSAANVAAQQILSAAVQALLGGPPGICVSPDVLGQTARTLALPLTHDSDPTFCGQVLASQRPSDVLSVLQALLGLAEAQARHEAEQFLNRELEARLNAAHDIVDRADLDAAGEALQRMSRRAWDDPEPYRNAAERLERTVGRFDTTRFMARFPIASQRPRIADSTGDIAAGVRVVTAALRAAERLAEIRAAIAAIAAIDSTTERALLLSETLDCASHRLDAWLTSLAARRLADARARGVRGLAVGAYGWVEGIDIASPVIDPTAVPLDVVGPVFQAATDGGFVLAPSPAHAATAAVLRGARLTHDPGDTGDGALNIDLSSTRVRAAMSVLDGIRSGQPLGALLGYRLEQWLHQRSPDGHPLDRFIYCLRSVAPLMTAKATDRVAAGAAVPESFESIAASEVVDGVRLLELHRADPGLIAARLDQPPADYATYMVNWIAPTPDEITAVMAAIARLDNVHDAVADLLLAESVHQLVLGAPARAAAAMDALAGDGIPPVPEVARTPRSGVALTHRLMLLTPDLPGAALSGWAVSARSATHPALEVWAAVGLGPATHIVLGADGAGTSITLAEAGISALDLLTAGGGSVGIAAFWSLLRRRVPALADQERPDLDRPAGLPAGALIFTEAWALAGSLQRVIAGCRALGPDDLLAPGEAGSNNEDRRAIDRNDLRGRADAALSGLQALVDAPVNAITRADGYALFGLGLSGDPTALPQNEFEAHVVALTSAAQQRLRVAAGALADYDAAPPVDDSRAVSALTEVISRIFEDKLPVLPVIEPAADLDAFAASLSAGVRVVSENRSISDGRDVRPWLTRTARVRPAVGRYAETLLLREAIGHRVPLRVAQLRDGAFGTWIGLPFGEITVPQDASVTGFVVETPAGADVSARVSGLVVDEWTDVVPARQSVRDPATGEPTDTVREVSTAGLAVNANGPNARAPQVLLLVMSPDGQPWSADKVVDVLADTYALAQERAVTLERVPLAARILPATYVQDWSLQGEPVLDMSRLLRTAVEQSAVARYVAEKS
ncbi:hypothetical protein BH09ACT7_BH09ACT7_35350 [soil metagenome]